MNAENLGGISTSKAEFFICLRLALIISCTFVPGVNRCQPHTRLISDPPGLTFSSCPTSAMFPSDAPEKISLQILLKGPIIEGNNVTLKCHADGNPQPSRFYFHLKVSQTPTGICCCGKSLVQNSASVPPVHRGASQPLSANF